MLMVWLAPALRFVMSIGLPNMGLYGECVCVTRAVRVYSGCRVSLHDTASLVSHSSAAARGRDL